MQKVNWLIVGVMSFIIILLLFGTGMLMSDWGFRGLGRDDLYVADPCRPPCAGNIRHCLACAERQHLQAAIFLMWIMDNDAV